MTIDMATHKWVGEFNAIPQGMVKKLMGVDPDDWKEVTKPTDYEFYESLPAWGTMWSFGDAIDDWWLENEDGIQKMSDCGFRIYYSDEFGYFFGIDGAGYDFYAQHWIPLYKARRLKWHETKE